MTKLDLSAGQNELASIDEEEAGQVWSLTDFFLTFGQSVSLTKRNKMMEENNILTKIYQEDAICLSRKSRK